ncbi:MAG: carboxypeptidase regulatory-like domain-containing protein [Verrucomicrobia bacterium]|nr:carboxypeptidase regulatory-like domain-containing protein [Verrucomicrobiota bacterium]
MNYLPSLSFFTRLGFTIAGLLALCVGLQAQSSSSGTIEGRVFDARRGEYVDKAHLSIEGTKLETLTDATGQYRLANVPAGSVKLRVFFTGTAGHVEVVPVAAGATVQRDITLGGVGARAGGADETVKLDQFVVSSSRQMDGAAIAINEQRFAPNLVNVVSADEFGSIADGSVGEFMKFLPGMTSDYTGGDARRVSINGVPAGNIPITFGGFDLASASAASTARTVELDQVSINSIARIEVMQSPTPESTGSALAGSVNFVPRSAFERSRPVYRYSVSLLMRNTERSLRETPGPMWKPSHKVLPGFDFSAIVPVNRKFGFTVSGGYSLQYTPQGSSVNSRRGVSSGTSTPAANGTPGAFPDTTADNPYLTDYTLRNGAKTTTRYSLGTTLDYRLGPNDRLSFSLQYAYLGEAFANRELRIGITRVLPGNWGPTFTHGAVGQSTLTNVINDSRLRPGRTVMPTLSYRHDGRQWKIDAGLGYSNSRIHYMDVDKGQFNNGTSTRTGLTINFDNINALRPGAITAFDAAGAPVDIYNLGTYSLASATSVQAKAYDEKITAYGNVRRDLEVQGVPIALKTGFDVRTTRRDVRSGTTHYSFLGRDGRGSTTPVGNDDAASAVLDESFSARPAGFGFPSIQWINNEKYYQLYRDTPAYFSVDTNNGYRSNVANSKLASEIISSVFLRADASFFDSRLKLVGGLRAEQTNVKAQGSLQDNTLNYQRDAAGKFVRGSSGSPLLIIPNTAANALAISQLTFLDRALKPEKEYLRLFPSLNASYNLRENVILRGSYYTSVGRPNFNQYAGALTLPDVEQGASSGNRISVNNVGLKAWSAQTYKVRLEYYFEKVGQISIGGFKRDFKNFFGNTVFAATPEFLALYDLDATVYGPFEVNTQYNIADMIHTAGAELDYKQALTFLPNWARGVQVFFNTSMQHATGPVETFQDLTPLTTNWGLSLTRTKFNLRANWNYRGLQRRGPIGSNRSIEPGSFAYFAARRYIDVSGEYYLRPEFGVFFSIRNIGAQAEDTLHYGPNTPGWAKFSRRNTFGGLWTFGVKGAF